jgi:hypothetical protein
MEGRRDVGGLIKIVLFLVALGYGAQYVKDHYIDGAADTKGPGGFVPVPAAQGLQADAVTIVTAPGATGVAAARGDAIAKALTEKGILVLRAQQVNFAGAGVDSVASARAMLIMGGEQPVVLVRGKAKANPTLQEVLVEFGAH